MSTLFTADLHLGHAAIVNMAKRPFADVIEMDNGLIDAWNKKVGPDDDVWVLGDFAHRSSKPASSYLARLNGRVNLIVGNHDSLDTTRAKGWASVQSMAEIVVDHRRIVLCHYAMRVWPAMRRHSLMLYGHSHGRLPGYKLAGGDGGTLDVGVDAWGYAPVSLGDILRRIRTLPEMPGTDHHYAGED